MPESDCLLLALNLTSTQLRLLKAWQKLPYKGEWG